MANLTLYRSEYNQMVIDHMAQGYPLETFATVVKVSRATIYNWASEFPEFLDSIKIGRDLSLKWFMDVGRTGMAGKIPGFNVAAWIFMMKNMHKWRDKDADVVDRLGMAGNVATVTSMTMEQKLEHARRVRSQLDDFIGANEPIRSLNASGVESEANAGTTTDIVVEVPMVEANSK